MTWRVEATGHLATKHTDYEGRMYEAFCLDRYREFLKAVEAFGAPSGSGMSRITNVTFVGSGIGSQDVNGPVGTITVQPPHEDRDEWARKGYAP